MPIIPRDQYTWCLTLSSGQRQFWWCILVGSAVSFGLGNPGSNPAARSEINGKEVGLHY